MISVHVKTFQNFGEVQREVEKKTRKAMAILGAVTRNEAAQSIKRRKKPSRPGEPPSSPTGKLKRTIRYELDRGGKSVVIGPVKTNPGYVPYILEVGGTTAPSRYIAPATVGVHAPIRMSRSGTLKGKKISIVRVYRDGQRITYWTARTQIRTAAQAQRANEILSAIYGGWVGKKHVRIAARPYMSRALKKIAAKATEILKKRL